MTHTAKKTAAAIVAEVKAVVKATPANIRRTLENYRALFVNLRGFKYEGSFGMADLATIKNTTGADLELVKAQLDNIAAAFKTLSTLKGQELYTGKVSGLMMANINNNGRFELARKEAQKELAKTTPAKPEEIAA